MLLPVAVVHPDCVSAFVVFRLELRKKLVDPALFRVVAVEPQEGGNRDHRNNGDRNPDMAAAGFGFVVRLGVKKMKWTWSATS